MARISQDILQHENVYSFSPYEWVIFHLWIEPLHLHRASPESLQSQGGHIGRHG